MEVKVIAQGKLSVVTRMVKKAWARTCGAINKNLVEGFNKIFTYWTDCVCLCKNYYAKNNNSTET